ncbi:hypothetical protein FIA58_019305 [Flavobacterium jejuense]|uniref:Uncharacterized protein n=1 Tax=Flavobacterium jejuense TaxID=1544455 RepID=A0ABX0IW84_9FLAO|nr:hypothetical protein [Flavobacterium jejuense]NHN27831.1 hypothetical protein [Flavobacterium jejuense]
MRNLKINILNEEGKLIGFQVDREIMNGLYITFDFTKVEKNYQNFKVDYKEPKESEFASVTLNMDDITILSTKLDADNHVQFVIEENMSLKKLRKVPENVIPMDFKKTIRTAYKKYYENTTYRDIAS